MPLSRPHSVQRLTLAAAFGLLLVCGQEARGQVPLTTFDWLRPIFLSDWLTRYWTDDEAEDGTRLASLPDMFGDSFARGGVLTTNNTVPFVTT